MTHGIALLIIVLLGGFVNRFRGGWLGSQLGTGTQTARAIFAGIMGIFVALAYGSWPLLLTVIAWEIGEFLPNGDYLGMTSVWQFAEATAVGLGNVCLVAVGIYFLDSHWTWWPLIIAGGMKGVVYYVANYKLSWWPTGIPGFSAGAEMAEFIFGAVLCLGIAVGGVLASL